MVSGDMVDLSTANEPLNNKMGSYDEKWLEESESMLLKQFDYEKRAILNMIMAKLGKQLRKQ